jgi:hypothetical protein
MNQKNEQHFNEEANKNFIKYALSIAEVNISFIKSNGELRNMKCTLKDDLIKDYSKKTDRVKTPSNEIQPVFDLDKQEWRSFRWDSIKHFNFTLGKL